MDYLNSNENDFAFPLDSVDIHIIIQIIEKYLDRDYYEDGQSIWEYEEYLVHNIKCIENLRVLEKYLNEHPDTKCYFYDSF